MINTFQFCILVAVCADLLVGVSVFLTNPRRTTNRLFLTLSVCLVVWMTCQFYGAGAATEDTFVFWVRQSSAASVYVLVLAAMLRTAIERPEAGLAAVARANTIWLGAATIAALLCQFPAFLRGCDLPSAANELGRPRYGPLFLPFVTYWVTGTTALIAIFVRGSRRAEGVRRIEMQYMALASAAGIVPGLVLILAVPSITGSMQTAAYAPFTVVVWYGTVAYGIATRRIMGVAEFLQRATTYLLVAGFLAGLYLLTFRLALALPLVPGCGGEMATLAHLTAALVAALSLAPVNASLHRKADRLFGAERERLADLLRHGRGLAHTFSSIEELASGFVRLLAAALKLEGVRAYVRAGDGFSLRAACGAAPAGPATVAADDPLVRALVTAETPLIRDTVRRAGASDDPRQVERDLDRLGAAAAVALRGRAAIEGLLLLGRRQGGLAFGHREVEALLLLGDQFGVTLENAMLEEQVRRGDRLASLGTLAAGMAHEIKNPLVSLKTFAQLLPERYDDPEFRSTFGPLIEDEVGRIDGLVGRLLDFARPAKPAMAPVSLHACIADSLRLVAQQAKAKGLAIERRYAAEEDGVSGDERLLRQVFVNLLLNAIDATPSGGALSVLTRLGERPADACRVAPPADRWIVAEVRDTGCGIAPSDRGRVFDPFFTTKPAGTGLGLSVAHGIVSEHQGCIAADSVPGQGSCFRVSLPLRPRRAS